MVKHVFIYSNDTEFSLPIKEKIRAFFSNSSSLEEDAVLTQDTDLIICIGGDGTLLHLIHELNFPETPIVGVNTGHLGFFQDLQPTEVEDFLKRWIQSGQHVQLYSTIQSQIWTGDKMTTLYGLNEMVIRGRTGSVIHLGVSIGSSFIEHFSGDGLLVSTPAGSTAYNYSLGGSIVDPRLELLQVTPIAPMNNNSYRSFTSSLILPSDYTLRMEPEEPHSFVQIETDGFVYPFQNVKTIRISYSKKKLRCIRILGHDFWKKVKDKYLG
ncbi:MAG: NAD(+)/NADH kinase [Eubacteriales bacterium]|nr:NAD(+)/NADH kinase [Eubacteriales bacterium]